MDEKELISRFHDLFYKYDSRFGGAVLNDKPYWTLVGDISKVAEVLQNAENYLQRRKSCIEIE